MEVDLYPEAALHLIYGKDGASYFPLCSSMTSLKIRS